jgi:HSP20 family protein
VKKDDIKVSVDGNQVRINANMMKESREDERILRNELYSGRAERSFSLESYIEEAEVQAHYNDGLLTLVLPKKKNQAGKNIQIR